MGSMTDVPRRWHWWGKRRNENSLELGRAAAAAEGCVWRTNEAAGRIWGCCNGRQMIFTLTAQARKQKNRTGFQGLFVHVDYTERKVRISTSSANKAKRCVFRVEANFIFFLALLRTKAPSTLVVPSGRAGKCARLSATNADRRTRRKWQKRRL